MRAKFRPNRRDLQVASEITCHPYELEGHQGILAARLYFVAGFPSPRMTRGLFLRLLCKFYV